MKRICKDCGKEFEITKSEEEFYKSKGLELPKRCKSCREKKKSGRVSHNAENSSKREQEYKENAGNQKERMPQAERHQDNEKSSLRNKIISAVAVIVIFIGGIFGINFNKTADNAKNNDVKIEENQQDSSSQKTGEYVFRNETLLSEHFDKHGADFDYKTKEEYEKGAAKVVTSKDALHKKEKEDGDDVYYIEKTNEFVIVSTDGYIRTYFKPQDGINYFNRQ